jgi:hypothetical protein
MEKAEYDIIKNNPKKAIGISQTDTGHQAFKIKKLEYDLIQGQATIQAWPKTFFNIQVIPTEVDMDDCSAPPPCCSYDCFSSSYKAILDYATLQGYTLPSDDQQCIQNQLVVDLKIAGIWDELDVLYVFATDGSEDFAKINWINPGTFTPVENGTVTFASNVGFQGNGTNGYLNTGYIPSTHAENYLANDASAFCYISNDVAATRFDFGVNGAINTPSLILVSRDAANTHTWRINFAPQQGGSNGSSIGFYQVQKRSTDARIFKNGVQSGATVSITATGVPDRFIPLFANNNNGSIGSYSNRQMGIFGLGASLDGKESELYTAWNDYFTSL